MARKNHEESQMQIACVTWFRYQYAKYDLCLFAVPNGGYRKKTEAKIMKAEGVTAGVSDLILAVPTSDYPGMFIEMKTKKGTVIPSQKKFLARMDELGYKTAVVRSKKEFMDLVNDYMSKLK